MSDLQRSLPPTLKNGLIAFVLAAILITSVAALRGELGDVSNKNKAEQIVEEPVNN